MARRHNRMLTELSEMELALVRDLHARMLAAQSAASVRDLAAAFVRASQSLRETLALQAQLERDQPRRNPMERARAARRVADRVKRRESEAQALLTVDRTRLN